MIVNYDEKFSQEVSSLLEENTTRLVWGSNADKTVLAFKSGELVAVGGLYTNEIHPHREYIAVYVGPAYRRQGIGTELFNELKGRAGIAKFQATISSNNREGVQFLHQLGFQLARKCYTPDLKSPKKLAPEPKLSTFKSLEKLEENQTENLISLQLENYRLTHEAINPLNELIPLKRWKELVFDGIDQDHSWVLIEENKILSYILSYRDEESDEIEIGYIGGRDEKEISTYLPFYVEIINGLISQFETVSIEADNVNPFAYAALNCYDYDPTESLDAYTL